MTSSTGGAVARRKSYWSASRSPRYSLLFALPLLVFYEILAVALPARQGGQLRNGADVLLQELSYALLGRAGPLALMALVILVCAVLVQRDMKRSGGGLSIATFGLMFVEAAVLSVTFGLVVGTATAQLLAHLRPLSMSPIAGLDTPTKLMLALGAGLYEELVFRVLLVGALAAGGRVVLLSRTTSGVIASIIGALVFSAFHYIGPYGEPLQLQSFVFRAISGVAFSALYLTRGFGITAWTHALYDIGVMIL